MCTEFGGDSSNGFSFTAWTNEHKATDITDHPIHESVTAIVGND